MAVRGRVECFAGRDRVFASRAERRDANNKDNADRPLRLLDPRLFGLDRGQAKRRQLSFATIPVDTGPGPRSQKVESSFGRRTRRLPLRLN